MDRLHAVRVFRFNSFDGETAPLRAIDDNDITFVVDDGTWVCEIPMPVSHT
jgi:hypothetical protein